MKKVKYISFLLIILVIMVGCDKKDANEILKEALDKTNNANSYKMEVRTTVGTGEYAYNERTIGDYEKNKSHYRVQISSADNAMDVEVYTVEKENQIYQYNSGDNGETWGYYVYDIPKVGESLQFLNSVVIISDAVTEVKTDLEGYKKLELKLNKEKAGVIFSQQEEMEGWDLSKDLIADVYIKDGYISKLEIDFGEMLTEEYKEDISVYTMNFSYTNYNKVEKIEIPEDILENAVLIDEEEEE